MVNQVDSKKANEPGQGKRSVRAVVLGLVIGWGDKCCRDSELATFNMRQETSSLESTATAPCGAGESEKQVNWGVTEASQANI